MSGQYKEHPRALAFLGIYSIMKVMRRASAFTTLAGIATRDPTSTQYHVYYVFENRRKPEFTKRQQATGSKASH